MESAAEMEEEICRRLAVSWERGLRGEEMEPLHDRGGVGSVGGAKKVR